MRHAPKLLLLAAAVTALVGASNAGATPSGSTFTVVAAENVWGSIASQLAGNRATVTSVLTNPATDPHSYEPTPSDARTLALSKVAIVNGIGYDNWASQLLDANPSGGRAVVDTGVVLQLKDGDNPHQWYAPSAVTKVAAAIAAAYARVDPAGASYYHARLRAFETKGLARYHALLASIRRRFAGVPVGYSESIFAPLGEAAGLRLATPAGFARAVAEGSDVGAGDREAIERDLRRRLVKVWIYNSQNETPDVQRVNDLARAEHIPVVAVTETLAPEGATFQQWQVTQLERLVQALHRATGR